MPDFPTVVAAIRDAVCAILRVKQAQTQGQFEVAFVGSGWCINAGRYVVTAHHIFNDGIARNPADKFFVFVVPGNGPAAYHTPVVGVPFEDAAIDMGQVRFLLDNLTGDALALGRATGRTRSV